MLYNILKQCGPGELAGTADAEIPEDVKKLLVEKPEAELETNQQKMKRRLQLKNKIQSVGRMNLMLANMRKN